MIRVVPYRSVRHDRDTRSSQRRSRFLVATLAAALTSAADFHGPARAQDAQIQFGKSQLVGVTLTHPTSLQFGPDGRLYVSEQSGRIYAYEIERTAPNVYEVTSTEQIDTIRTIPNHNDDGALNTSLAARQVTGILVTGTAANPTLYVSSSDPRIGGGSSGTDKNLDTNSGIVSRLTWNGAEWTKLDLVRGLPRSEENHASNGLVLDEATNTLYVAQGGHTNMGAPSNNLALLPEYALSGAILSIDLDAIGESTYDLPTLDDEDRAGVVDAGDPFGGNDGKNQAVLVPGGPVQIHSPGYRNPYDLVITTAGRMYTIDNGPNSGWGGLPVGEGAAGCTNDVVEAGNFQWDNLHHVTGPGYYGGHANPTRANAANTFNASNPQSPISAENPIECDYRAPGDGDGALWTFKRSTNGMVEYRAGNFGAAMRGDLLTASFDNQIWRIELDASGSTTTNVAPIFSAVGTNPLDVTAQGDNEVFPGTIWVADWASEQIVIFEPTDMVSCVSAAECDDGDPCTDDACVDESCQHSLNTAPCDDGVACTAGDACSSGECIGADACPAGETCDPVSGQCEGGVDPILDATLDEDFHIPGTQVGDIVPGIIQLSEDCRGCHGPYDVANDPYSTWRGSIKAHAGRDPLFRAQMTTANQDVANAGYFCIRCHMPMSIITGHADITDGSVLDDTELDGINCHFCHAMVDPLYKPGVSPIEDLTVIAAHDDVPSFYGNSMFLLDPSGLRRGPYDDADAQHDWVESPFHRESAFCGTCHDIGNVAVSRQPNGTYRYNALGEEAPGHDPLQLFPLQRTYTEWELSAFAEGGVDMGGRFGGVGSSVVETCQDCHMPKAQAAGCVFSDERPDLARHEFAGGSAPVLDLIAELYKDDPAVDLPSIARGKAASISMLQRAATLELGQSGDDLDVRVINETGHKLPTGHNEGRRIWIHVGFLDGSGALIAEHGHYDTAQAELDVASTVVFEMHVGLSNDAAAVTGLPAGVTTRMALADTIVKDNRIPPRGFSNAAFENAGAPVVGETYDDGQYWHDSRFEIPQGATRAEVTLYYQSTPREYIEALRDENVTNHWGDTLHAVWEATGRGAPIAMQTATIEVAASCQSGADCNDDNPCTDDACVSNLCTRTPRTGSCSDGNTCTLGDACVDGACVGTSRDCSTLDDACNVGVCAPESGECEAEPISDGSSCDDGRFCTQTDLCVAGACVGSGDPCVEQDECRTTCSETQDACLDPAGTGCTDDGNPCTNDVCDASGNCVHPFHNAPCDDGNYCNGADFCRNGTCSEHSGDPCFPGQSCVEATDTCSGQACVELSIPTTLRCAAGRDCTLSVSIETSSYDVGHVAAVIETEVAHSWSLDSLMGSGGANGQCTVAADTYSFVATDSDPYWDVLTTGELARLNLRCEAPASGEICIEGSTAALLGSIVVPLPTCAPVCGEITCGSCMPGDCDGDGTVDAADARCAALCVAGTPPANADCSCAADCNCTGGTEASDPVCTALRATDALAADSCVTPSPAIEAGDVELRSSAVRTLPSGKRKWSIVRLAGDDAASTAAVRTAVWTDGSIVKIRLSRRLRIAGFTMTRARSAEDRAVFVVTPPSSAVSSIGAGRIARVILATTATAVTLTSPQFGDARGLPRAPSP